jgi:transposase-like protein
MSNDTTGADVTSLLDRIRDARFPSGVHCPRCGSPRVARWGSFSGRQRHRCRGCERTFSDLTHTPAAYTKKLSQWTAYADCLAECASIRSAARALGIAVSTAFRWRHAILDELSAADRETLSGVVEIGDLWFAHSRKGERQLSRPARKRGSRSRVMFPGRVVRVIAACDRVNGVVTDVALTKVVRLRDLIHSLQKRLAGKPVLLAAQGPLGPVGSLARSVGGGFVDVRGGVALRPGTLWHLRMSRGYARRLSVWIRRFRGVATKYLGNYLIWHRIIDASDRRKPALAVLHWCLSHGFT